MTDNVIWHTDFRARREREAAELEMASVALITEYIPPPGPAFNFDDMVRWGTKKISPDIVVSSDTSPSEMNPQDSA